MKRTRILSALLGLLVSASLLCAQTANPKQPEPKSQKEGEAIMAMFQASDAPTRIKAAMDLITQFADTEFKATAFYVAAVSAREMGDADNIVVYSEKALEADKMNYGAMLLLSGALAQRTREFDLDREEKLGRAEKLANDALTMVKDAPKPNPGITDEQWEAGKKDFSAQAYEALGMAAMIRKKYDVCAQNFQLAADNAFESDAALYVRLANCLRNDKKLDEALVAVDKALANPNAHPQVKQAAVQEKMVINKAKADAAKQ